MVYFKGTYILNYTIRISIHWKFLVKRAWSTAILVDGVDTILRNKWCAEPSVHGGKSTPHTVTWMITCVETTI